MPQIEPYTEDNDSPSEPEEETIDYQQYVPWDWARDAKESMDLLFAGFDAEQLVARGTSPEIVSVAIEQLICLSLIHI